MSSETNLCRKYESENFIDEITKKLDSCQVADCCEVANSAKIPLFDEKQLILWDTVEDLEKKVRRLRAIKASLTNSSDVNINNITGRLSSLTSTCSKSEERFQEKSPKTIQKQNTRYFIITATHNDVNDVILQLKQYTAIQMICIDSIGFNSTGFRRIIEYCKQSLQYLEAIFVHRRLRRIQPWIDYDIHSYFEDMGYFLCRSPFKYIKFNENNELTNSSNKFCYKMICLRGELAMNIMFLRFAANSNILLDKYWLQIVKAKEYDSLKNEMINLRCEINDL